MIDWEELKVTHQDFRDMQYNFLINGTKAERLGLVIGMGAIDALHAPLSRKEYITNESASIDGQQVLVDARFLPCFASRDINIVVYIIASTSDDYLAKYNALMNILNSGVVDLTEEAIYENFRIIRTNYQLIFKSCTTFSEFNGKMAKMQLRFNEPNPTLRD